MTTFCTDIDLLHWEPNILRDAAFASQTLLAGTGDLAGTTFTLDTVGASFLASHVEADQVIVLSGGTSGCYPIVSVNSATQLTISTLFDGLFPLSGNPTPIPVGSAVDLAFVVRTFWPQRRVITELLLAAAGLDPVLHSVDRVMNPQALRKACALGSLHMIYSALAAAAAEPAAYGVRAELYERLYRRALRGARVELDLNGDGAADAVRPLNVLHMQRL
jgi:hypothetical protein